MLRTRVLTAVVLLPVVIGLICLGGVPLLALVALLLSLAEVEFCRLMAQDNFRPVLAFGLAIIGLFLLDAQIPGTELLRPGLTIILLASLAWQLLHRQGSPVADWALTVVGGLYLGLCGAGLVRLRGLHDGFWWTLTVLFTILTADSGAYFVGRAWGRHRLAPILSPGKTWEGYLGGVVSGGLLATLMVTLWRPATRSGMVPSSVHGLILGLLIATFAPLGDLAVSMIKRQAGVKDSGNIIPGHGGVLDRLDSVLWAVVIGYYYVLWFVT